MGWDDEGEGRPMGCYDWLGGVCFLLLVGLAGGGLVALVAALAR